jgi:hypothetical protein
MDWFESLPSQCPPNEAFDPTGHVFYRLSISEPPKEIDFLSNKFRFPNQAYNGVSDCIARSLSVFDDISKCVNLKKLPRHKTKSIMMLNLTISDGLVMKTFKDENHYSWWRTKQFKLADAIIIK